MRASTDSCSSSIRRSGYLPLSFTRAIRRGHRSGLRRGETSGLFVGRVSRRRLLPARCTRLIRPLLTAPLRRPCLRSAQSRPKARTTAGPSQGEPVILVRLATRPGLSLRSEPHTSTGSTDLAIRQIGDFFRKRPINPPTISGRRFGRLGGWEKNRSRRSRRRGSGGGSHLDKNTRFSNVSEPVA